MISPTDTTAAEAIVRLDQGWVRFHRPIDWIEAKSLDTVIACLKRVEARAAEGYFAVGYVAFEAAAAMDEALSSMRGEGASGQAEPSVGQLPLLGFSLFEEAEAMPDPFARSTSTPRADWTLQEGEDSQRYLAAVEQILQGIAAGDIYQVNYTFPLFVSLREHLQRLPKEERASFSLQLFERLCHAQGGTYGCFLRAGDLEICSASPELFFEVHGEQITTQPMKGTAPRGRFSAEDRTIARELSNSEKNRAENLMIVDMMRNDLGRIAHVGSVRVPSLFDVQRLPTLHQMTSTVCARTDASLANIFTALFPCSSITGAPKSTALEAIRRLEKRARGVYTGAVGVVLPAAPETLGFFARTPPARPPSDRPVMAKGRYARFNVAIRTAWRSSPKAPFHYGVGSGIVWDSRPEQEHQECRSKALAFAEQPATFRLLETMLLRAPSFRFADPVARIWLLRQHLTRLQSSAEYFSFPFNPEGFQEQLAQALESPTADQRCRLRVLLDETGALEIQTMAEPRHPRRVIRVALAAKPIDATDPFLFHKTTHRGVYLEALEAARDLHGAVDDVLLFNQNGELTESCSANLLLEPTTPGQPWRTPPRSAGLLAGTLRQALLERARITEAPLHKKDLLDSISPLLINSVRGFLPIKIVAGKH